MQTRYILSTKVDSKDDKHVSTITAYGFPDDECADLLGRVHEFGGENGLYDESGNELMLIPSDGENNAGA